MEAGVIRSRQDGRWGPAGPRGHNAAISGTGPSSSNTADAASASGTIRPQGTDTQGHRWLAAAQSRAVRCDGHEAQRSRGTDRCWPRHKPVGTMWPQGTGGADQGHGVDRGTKPGGTVTNAASAEVTWQPRCRTQAVGVSTHGQETRWLAAAQSRAARCDGHEAQRSRGKDDVVRGHQAGRHDVATRYRGRGPRARG